MTSGTAVSRLKHEMLPKRQGTKSVDRLTGTAEELQSTSVELQNVSVYQFKVFSHVSMPLEELAVFQELGKVLADLLISIE